MRHCAYAYNVILVVLYYLFAMSVIEEDRSCTVSALSSPLHLIHSSTTKHSCGTKHQPWVIEAPLGQNVNVSLLDLSHDTTRTAANQQLTRSCHQYGYIIDRSTNKNISLCALYHERKKLIYKSSSNVIEVVLSNPASIGHNVDMPKVLLGFIGEISKFLLLLK